MSGFSFLVSFPTSLVCLLLVLTTKVTKGPCLLTHIGYLNFPGCYAMRTLSTDFFSGSRFLKWMVEQVFLSLDSFNLVYVAHFDCFRWYSRSRVFLYFFFEILLISVPNHLTFSGPLYASRALGGVMLHVGYH